MAEIFKEKSMLEIEFGDSSVKSDDQEKQQQLESEMNASNKDFENDLLSEVIKFFIAKFNFKI